MTSSAKPKADGLYTEGLLCCSYGTEEAALGQDEPTDDDLFQRASASPFIDHRNAHDLSAVLGGQYAGGVDLLNRIGLNDDRAVRLVVHDQFSTTRTAHPSARERYDFATSPFITSPEFARYPQPVEKPLASHVIDAASKFKAITAVPISRNTADMVIPISRNTAVRLIEALSNHSLPVWPGGVI